MPLADVESRLKDFRAVVEWIDNHLTQVGTALTSLGCPSHKQTFHKGACLGEHLETLQGQVAAIDEHRLTDYLLQLQKQLDGEAKAGRSSALGAICRAIKDRSSEDYKKAYEEATRLAGLRPSVVRLEHLLKRLQSVAPKWASKVEREAAKSGVGALPQDWALAWRWRRLNEWLIRLHNPLERRKPSKSPRKGAESGARQLITQLVTERTWERQISNIEDRQYMALTAWANAMRQFGKGTGKYAQRHLAAANRAMVEAVGAVPVWIMPLFGSFNPSSETRRL